MALKQILSLCLIVTPLFAMGFGSGPKVDIESEGSACVKGNISMRVKVSVDGETVELSPSCSFSYSKDFKSKSGAECRVKAGMCSGFSPEHELQVECRDHNHNETKRALPIACKTAGAKGNLIIETENRCRKGRMSEAVEIQLAGEKYRFDPSCSFSYSHNFKTRAGVGCKIESGMCSSFSPKRRFVVKCDDGVEGEAGIACP